MNKKNILIILIILFITGCGNKSTPKDIENYLIENYPNETFKIVSKEIIKNIKSSGFCNTDESGYKYIVISNDTNIQFLIEDIYEASSYGTCYYDLYDNYYEVALEKYIEEFNDSRISLDTHMLSSNIKIDYKKFKSKDEIADVLYKFKMYYESKKPFMDEVDVSVYIYNSSNYLGSIYLSHNNREITLNNITQEIIELL